MKMMKRIMRPNNSGDMAVSLALVMLVFVSFFVLGMTLFGLTSGCGRWFMGAAASPPPLPAVGVGGDTTTDFPLVAPLRWVSALAVILAVVATGAAFIVPTMSWKAVVGLWASAIAGASASWLLAEYGKWIALALLAAAVAWLVTSWLQRTNLLKQGLRLAKGDGDGPVDMRAGIALMAAGHRLANKNRKVMAENPTEVTKKLSNGGKPWTIRQPQT